MGLLAARLACLAGRGLGWLAGRAWVIAVFIAQETDAFHSGFHSISCAMKTASVSSIGTALRYYFV